MEIDSHIGCAMSGLTADARILVNHARADAQNYRFNYDEPMRIESCTQGVSDLALRFGEDRDDDEDAMVLLLLNLLFFPPQLMSVSSLWCRPSDWRSG